MVCSALRVPVNAVLALVLGLMVARVAWSVDAQAEAQQTWQLLDYIAVDYAGAVSNGNIVDPNEYREMQEFAAAIRNKLAELPATPQKEALSSAARKLEAAISAFATPEKVANQAHALADDLMSAYHIEATPKSVPDVAGASALYAQHCAVCHGVTGGGDGPAALNLEPKPIAFSDTQRAAQRSPLALYQVISQGLDGTSMTGFAQLPEEDRWALAFYVGGLAYPEASRSAGETLWRSEAELREAIPSLAALSGNSEAALSKAVGTERAKAITAYLRANPRAVEQHSTTPGSLHIARQRLAESIKAYANGDAAQARASALSSYLDGVEPVEPTLAARDQTLMREVEAAMAQLRDQLGHGASVNDLTKTAAVINVLFDRAEMVLQDSRADATTAFLGSFTILLREGLEALLIVIGMIAFLRKAERREVLPYVHAGWVGALLAGALTWAIATHVVDISGANREVTEGLSALFAAVVLLSVGIWMHQKSLAGRWQQYLEAKLSAALSQRSALFLFTLAFLAVYREVFETILFFIAMWSTQNASAIVSGLLAAVAVLTVIAFLMLRASKRLPIGQFFSISSIVIAVLAVVLVGKGVAALQEAGWVAQALVGAPRIEWLGIFPSVQSLSAQLLVGVIAGVGFIVNVRLSSASEAKSEESQI